MFHAIVLIIQHLQDLAHDTCNAIATNNSAYIDEEHLVMVKGTWLDYDAVMA